MNVPSRALPLAGWGRYPVAECSLVTPATAADAVAISNAADSLIARGRGRSYGDSSLNPDLTVDLTRLNRLVAFDPDTGLLVCEGGLGLDDLLAILVPRGWFAPVTPGSRFVTIGGMIASDVHGKNHHGSGSFCDHVAWLELALPGGRIVRCSRQEHADLFAATCGGMGLTGLILRAAVRLLPIETARIRQRTIRAPDLGSAIDLFEATRDWTYSVGWIDCLASGRALGRSVLFLGEHAKVDELPVGERANPFARRTPRMRSVPIDFPSFVLGPLSVRAFNQLYYRAQQPGDALVELDPYFYPLDAIGNWNRIYGRGGFVQYQCVLPLETARDGLTQLLSAIADARRGSFLAVLKRMGEQSFGLLSFPMPGYTLALDFPVDDATFRLLRRLDAITAQAGGRIYLAKDSRIDAASFAAGYPRLPEFRAVRSRWGLDKVFSSLQSRRLEL